MWSNARSVVGKWREVASRDPDSCICFYDLDTTIEATSISGKVVLSSRLLALMACTHVVTPRFWVAWVS